MALPSVIEITCFVATTCRVAYDIILYDYNFQQSEYMKKSTATNAFVTSERQHGLKKFAIL